MHSGATWAQAGTLAPPPLSPQFPLLAPPPLQLTLERILSQAQLPNDVLWQVQSCAWPRDLALGSFQQVVKLLRVKLLGMQRDWSIEAWSHLQAFTHPLPPSEAFYQWLRLVLGILAPGASSGKPTRVWRPLVFLTSPT